MTSPLADTTRHESREARSRRTNQLLAQAAASAGIERQRLLDEVVIANVEVARSVAGRFRNRGIPLEDLEQVACLALVGAANRFRPDKADDFLTYAVPTIKGELKRHFRDHGWTVRPPRRIQEVQALLGRDASAGRGVHERPEQTAERLGLTVEEVHAAQQAQGCFTPVSLDTPVGDVDGSEVLADLVVSDDEFTAWDAVEARVILATLTAELSARDRLILFLRFHEGRTQAEIGEEIGVTQMQVSRLLSRILDTMRDRLEQTPATHVA